MSRPFASEPRAETLRTAFDRRSIRTKKSGGALWAPPLCLLKRLRVLAQVVRHVVERGVQLRTDALHRANRRNGDESGDQAVLDGGGTLAIANQLKKLAHGLRSLVPSSDGKPP